MITLNTNKRKCTIYGDNILRFSFCINVVLLSSCTILHFITQNAISIGGNWGCLTGCVDNFGFREHVIKLNYYKIVP